MTSGDGQEVLHASADVQLVFSERDDVIAFLHDSRYRADDFGKEYAVVMGSSGFEERGEQHAEYRRWLARAIADVREAPHFTASLEDVGERHILAMRRRGHGDLLRHFVLPFFDEVTSRLFGFPAADMSRIRSWTRRIVAGEANWTRATVAGSQLQSYLSGMVPRITAARGRNLVCRLFEEFSEREVSLVDVTAAVRFLIPAALETGYRALSFLLFCVARDGAVWDAVKDNSELQAVAVEEALRLAPPLRLVVRAGPAPAETSAPIGRGLVFGDLLSANRDPTWVAEGDCFRLSENRAAGHLTFGAGRHSCLGAGLARMELRMALAAVVSSVARPRIVETRPSSSSGLFCGPMNAWLTWE